MGSSFQVSGQEACVPLWGGPPRMSDQLGRRAPVGPHAVSRRRGGVPRSRAQHPAFRAGSQPRRPTAQFPRLRSAVVLPTPQARVAGNAWRKLDTR